MEPSTLTLLGKDSSRASNPRWIDVVGFLRATGGMITPDKSKWFLIDLKWTGTDSFARDAGQNYGA